MWRPAGDGRAGQRATQAVMISGVFWIWHWQVAEVSRQQPAGDEREGWRETQVQRKEDGRTSVITDARTLGCFTTSFGLLWSG